MTPDMAQLCMACIHASRLAQQYREGVPLGTAKARGASSHTYIKTSSHPTPPGLYLVPLSILLCGDKGLLNGYSSTGVSLWDSQMFGRVLKYSTPGHAPHHVPQK